MARGVALDLDAVPAFSVSNVADRKIVVLAPEERDSVEGLGAPKHIAGGHLSLPLGKHPMLDADAATGMRIRPPRDVPGSKDARSARLQMRIDKNTVIDGKPGFLGNANVRPHADPGDDEVGGHPLAVLERHVGAVD